MKWFKLYQIVASHIQPQSDELMIESDNVMTPSDSQATPSDSQTTPSDGQMTLSDILLTVKLVMESSTIGEYSALLNTLLAFHCQLIHATDTPHLGISFILFKYFDTQQLGISLILFNALDAKLFFAKHQ